MRAVSVLAIATVLAFSTTSLAFAKHRHHHHSKHGTTASMTQSGPSGPGQDAGATDKSRPGSKGVSRKPAE
jgi:hypothetical protein